MRLRANVEFTVLAVGRRKNTLRSIDYFIISNLQLEIIFRSNLNPQVGVQGLKPGFFIIMFITSHHFSFISQKEDIVSSLQFQGEVSERIECEVNAHACAKQDYSHSKEGNSKFGRSKLDI